MEAEDFPRNGKYPKDVPLLSYLDYIQSVKSIILDWDLKMLKSWMFLLVVKGFVSLANKHKKFKAVRYFKVLKSSSQLITGEVVWKTTRKNAMWILVISAL